MKIPGITLHSSFCLCVKVVVGGSASGWGPLEDNFSTTDERLWLLHPGGTHMPVCGSDGSAFAFIEKSNTRYAVTTDISVGQDALIQFDFSASCSVTSSCYCKPANQDLYTIHVLLSHLFTNMNACLCVHSSGIGLLSWPWTYLATSLKRLFTHKSRLFLLYTSKDVSFRHLQQMGQSYLTHPCLCQVKLYWVILHNTFTFLLTFKYPSTNTQFVFLRSPATRFRWLQQAPFDKQQTWALDNLYIGDGCPEMCSGHGRCKQNSCVWVNCIFHS